MFGHKCISVFPVTSLVTVYKCIHGKSGNNRRSTHQSWRLLLIPIHPPFDDTNIFGQIQMQIK